MLKRHRQSGAALIEALVATLIVSFGLMALAGLHTTMNAAVHEAYQRTQALTLMQDMVQRIEVNQASASSYVTATPLGTDDTDSCLAASAPGATLAQRDQCEWSLLLQGASEKAGSTAVGAMIGGRGCIEQLQAPDPASGVCQPGIYRVTVAWQGFTATVAPAVTCGQGLYSREVLRKALASQVLVALPACS